MTRSPCGYFNDKHPDRMGSRVISARLRRFGGPRLDRVNIHIEVPAVQYKELRDGPDEEGSHRIPERVLAARESQHVRLVRAGERTNGWAKGALA